MIDQAGSAVTLSSFKSPPCNQLGGKLLTDLHGFGRCRRGRRHLNHGLAVRSYYLGVEPVMLALGHAVGANRKLAAAAQRVKDGAFSIDREACVLMLEEGNGIADEGVPAFIRLVAARPIDRASLKGERSLAGRGAHLLGREALVDPFGALEAIEPGGGEDEGVSVSALKFLEAGVDVPSDLYEVQVRAQGQKLGPAARAGGADAASFGEGVERPVGLTHPDVAGVGALGNGGQGKLRGQRGG